MTDAPTSVVIGVCTFRRPQQLARLLAVLLNESLPAVPDLELTILVVDDDPAASAADVVRAAGEGSTRAVVYRHVGSQNLSRARNAVIESGCELGQWLSFVDDDCLPDPRWLAALLEVQEHTAADIVTGRVVYRCRQGAAAWLTDEPFCDLTEYADGEEPAFGNTANVLLRTAFLAASKVRFRPALGHTGGEDMTFFSDARRAGAVLRHSAGAVVFEELTPARETLGYHLHRQFWLGNNMVVINRQTHAESQWRLLARGAKRAVTSLVAPVGRLMQGRPPQVRWALAYSLQGLGLVAGVLGATVRHRT